MMMMMIMAFFSIIQKDGSSLAKGLNIILAKKMGYKVVAPCYMGIIFEHIVYMVK